MNSHGVYQQKMYNEKKAWNYLHESNPIAPKDNV